MSDILNLPIPKPRNLYFYEDVNCYSIQKLSESIIEINEHDQQLLGIFKLYNLNYEPSPIKI